MRTARALVPEVRKAVAVLSQIPEHKALVRQLYKHNTELDRITKGIRMTSTEGMYHIVWQDDRDGDWQIFYKKIDQNGNEVLGDLQLSDGRGSAVHPMIACDHDDNLHIIILVMLLDNIDDWIILR